MYKESPKEPSYDFGISFDNKILKRDNSLREKMMHSVQRNHQTLTTRNKSVFENSS